MKLLVSVQCLVYNHELYLNQCLDSILMQQTKFDYEIVIHEDCSTDKSKKIIQEYVDKYPDIIKPIYQKENQYGKIGFYGIFQIMTAKSQGKYLAICEGDDFWIDSYKLQKQVDFLENHSDYSMCFHNAIVLYQNLNKDAHVFCRNMNKSKNILLKEIVSDWIIPTASIVLRKDIYPLPLWTSNIYSYDMTLALWAYDKGHVYYISDLMSCYRKNETGMSDYSNNSVSKVLNQKVLLFSFFNKETNYKYNDILLERIKFYRKSSLFWEYRNKNLLLAFIKMPLFFLKKIMIVIKRKL